MSRPVGSDCVDGVFFAIDEIVVDPPCVEFDEWLGHTLVLTMRVATGTDSASIDDASVIFDPYSFIVIGKDDVSQKAGFGLCADATGVPDTFGPNQEYAFTLELEVPVAHGVLALQPGMVGESGSGGREWTF